MNLPSSTATPTSTSSPSPSDAPPREICSDCGSKDSWVIHTVRLRGLVRAFCTHCLLRNHPQSFCPTCFVFFDSSPPHPSRRTLCANCLSNTHTQCIGEEKASTYLCPPCRNPYSFSFFRPIIGADGTRIVDQSLSEVFFCAAKIAYSSMSKAVHSAKTDCDSRGKKAALARKRAREQLEEVVMFDGKEKARFSGAKVLKEAIVVEQKPKLLTPVTAASNGGNAAKEKETEKNNGGAEKQQSQVKNNGGAEKQGLQLAKVKQEGGVDGSK